MVTVVRRRALSAHGLKNATLNPSNEIVSRFQGYEDLRSESINLLAQPYFDPASPMHYDAMLALGEALVPPAGNQGNAAYFVNSARLLYSGECMGELRDAARENRRPKLGNVYARLAEANEYDPATGKPVKVTPRRPRAVCVKMARKSQACWAALPAPGTTR